MTTTVTANTRALISWALLAEPGDQDASMLVHTLGAEEALARVIAGTTTEHGASEYAATRWAPRLDDATNNRRIDDVITATRKAGAELVDPLLIPRLADLGEHAPLLLWVKGDVNALHADRAVTVTGARACTGYGEIVTAELVSKQSSDTIIHSAAAYGIDARANQTALSAGNGTVAWQASGIDRPYPIGNTKLIDEISRTENCAVVTESVPGTAPSRWRFIARSRLMAAISKATIVVEAGWSGGALTTAAYARDLGRNLGAVPGMITSPASAGCHRLINEYGARAITTSADIHDLIV